MHLCGCARAACHVYLEGLQLGISIIPNQDLHMCTSETYEDKIP